MSRLYKWMAGAAALVAAGATVAVGLMQSAQQQDPPINCAEACSLLERAADQQKWPTFFLAIPQGVPIPKAHGDYLLGDCSNGVCTIRGPQSCECGIDYLYHVGPLVDGYRIAEVKAPAYVAAGWRAWAQDTAEAKWFAGFSQAVTACLNHTTAAKCLQLFDATNHCWLLDTGDICRYGQLVRTSTPGDDPPLACPYARVVRPMLCVTDRGAGSEMVAEDVDAELDVE